MTEIFHRPQARRGKFEQKTLIDLGQPSSENTPISKPTFKRMKKQPVFDVAPAERRKGFFSTRKMNASQSLENMRNLTLGKICPKDVRASFPLPSYGSIFTSSSLRHAEAEGIETETPSVLCGWPTCFR